MVPITMVPYNSLQHKNAAPPLAHAPCPLALAARGRGRCPLCTVHEPPAAECHDDRVRLELVGEVRSAAP